MSEPLRIFIGYDTAEERAFTVCAKSIMRRASVPVQIHPLRQDWLRSLGIYWRPREEFASTEFSFTRFLVPALCGYHGPALFVDADFLFLADVAELFAYYDPLLVLRCVQHVHQPQETTKMGGVPQTTNARKNWSSLILFSTGHHLVHRFLTPRAVNTRTGAWLHQFLWAEDQLIGSLPEAWNVLSGHTKCDNPKAIHFTNGVPTLHPGKFDHEELWIAEEQA